MGDDTPFSKIMRTESFYFSSIHAKTNINHKISTSEKSLLFNLLRMVTLSKSSQITERSKRNTHNLIKIGILYSGNSKFLVA